LLFALLALVAVACGDSPEAAPTATVTQHAIASPAPTATATPTPDLGAQIGARGDLPLTDPIDLAVRFGRVDAAPEPIATVDPGLQVGHQREFFALRLTSSVLARQSPPEVAPVSATLLAVGERSYVYVQDSLGVSADAAELAAQSFDGSVWPSVTDVFGEPDIGGGRIIVLQADLGGVGGYFAIQDTYPASAVPHSNEAHMIYVDRTLATGGASYNAVVAHELQHLIHATYDPGEDAWVNEGLSEVASALAGGSVSSIDAFRTRPWTSLTAWDSAIAAPHYGAAASFFTYVAGRLGEESMGGIARDRGVGPAGVEAWLAAAGHEVSFRDVFADWIAANVLGHESGTYGYPTRSVQVSVTDSLARGGTATGDATQFGTDYYELDVTAGGPHRLTFEGVPDVSVLPEAAGYGDGMLWSNRGDWINTRLTREVALTGIDDPALTFRTWFDIETWWDWAYVSVSTDDGATWAALPGSATTDFDPIRAAYGPGYTGASGGGAEPRWVDESIDLSAYAGETVLLRFEYVTDASTHGEGWVVADVAIDGLGLLNPDGWASEGWVEVDGTLDQEYVVRLILERADGDEVIDLDPNAAAAGELTFSTAGVTRAVLAVVGTTEGTHQRAPYTVELRAD
jgi:immune inhibitor A